MKVEVAIDSGAAECVCGLDHFPGANVGRAMHVRMVGGSQTLGSRTSRA